MNFSPRLEPEVAYVLAGLVLLAAIYWIFRSQVIVRKGLKIPILVCRILLVALLLFIFLNPISTDEIETPQGKTLLLIDNSKSMGLDDPHTRLAQAKEWVAPLTLLSDPERSLRVASFSEGLNRVEALESLELGGEETNLGAALLRTFEAAEGTLPAGIVIVSDGRVSDRNELNTALAQAQKKGIPFLTHAVGAKTPPRNAAIHQLEAPRSARAETRVPVSLQLRTDGFPQGHEFTVSILDEAGETKATQKVKASPDPIDFKIPLTTGIRTETYRVELSEDPNEITLADNSATFTVEVRSQKLRVLFIEGTHYRRIVLTENGYFYWNDIEFISNALESTGEIEVDSFTPLSQRSNFANLYAIRGYIDGRFDLDSSRSFPVTREELFRYDVILCSDIPVGNFNTDQMEAVVEMVTQRGAGFCMIGGVTAFDAGFYDRTPWERITPVDMVNFGHGVTRGHIPFQVPAAVAKHPIWKILDEPEANQKLLDAHPPFVGAHDIMRAKPGATILGIREDTGAPMLVSQSYGRGRSLALLTDTNGGWGPYHIAWGSEVTGTSVEQPQELGRGAFLLNTPRSEGDTMNGNKIVHPSPYYARFWLNAVRWLGEKSIRQQQTDLLGQVESASLRPGEEVEVSVEVLAALSPAEIPLLEMTATLSAAGAERQRLEWDPDRREFVGRLKVPTGISGSVASVIFQGKYQDQIYQDEINVSILRISSEFKNPLPDRQLLEDLAKNSGGQYVETPEEAAAALQQILQESEQAKVLYTRPLWDRWWVWLIALVLLILEWLLRRKASSASRKVALPA